MNTRFPINRWAPDDRPREKLVKFGHKSLTSSELLAILLGSGTPNESAVMLAQRMLAQYDNHLDQLAQCYVEELCEFHGVGLAKAIPTNHNTNKPPTIPRGIQDQASRTTH